MHNFPHDARADESLIDYDSPHAAHRDEVSQASYDKDVELEATGAKRPS